MSKFKNVVVLSGVCAVVFGACAYVTMAVEPAAGKTDTFADKMRFSPAKGETLTTAMNAGNAKLDRGIQVAQAATAAAAPVVAVKAVNAGVSVGVEQKFSSWSDLTAMFRPSRWSNPFRAGGTLCWLNYYSWASVPGRTAKVLLGEAIIAGAVVAIVEGTRDDDSSSSSSTSSSSSSGSSSTSSSSSGSSSTSSSSSGSSSTSSSSSGGSTSSSSSSGEVPF